jgi:hypothetical protein
VDQCGHSLDVISEEGSFAESGAAQAQRDSRLHGQAVSKAPAKYLGAKALSGWPTFGPVTTCSRSGKVPVRRRLCLDAVALRGAKIVTPYVTQQARDLRVGPWSLERAGGQRGTSATRRSGAPDPPAIFIGSARIQAPRSGT